MTLDEAIEMHEKRIKFAQVCIPCSGCPIDECIEEHQLHIEWLKELKAYKDFEDKGYVMCRFEVAQDNRHRTTKMVLDFSARELFDNIREVNADDSSKHS